MPRTLPTFRQPPPSTCFCNKTPCLRGKILQEFFYRVCVFFAIFLCEQNFSSQFRLARFDTKLIVRIFHFLPNRCDYAILASSRFSPVRLTSFTSIQRRNEPGSQPRPKPSALAFSMIHQETCTESFQWREQR